MLAGRCTGTGISFRFNLRKRFHEPPTAVSGKRPTDNPEEQAVRVPLESCGWRQLSWPPCALVHGNITFIDYFVLLKIGDGWKIANKAFHAKPHRPLLHGHTVRRASLHSDDDLRQRGPEPAAAAVEQLRVSHRPERRPASATAQPTVRHTGRDLVLKLQPGAQPRRGRIIVGA
jgi:hypothetical protein